MNLYLILFCFACVAWNDSIAAKYEFTSCWTTTNSYNGYATKTMSGKTCQYWRSNFPHKHKYHSSPLNYCRNPDHSKGGPWCYTTDKKKRWEYCGIPKCGKRTTKYNLKKCYLKKRLDSYVGYERKTVTGKKCQRWRSNYPHRHRFHKLPSNYCRNPDNTKGGPWCYTTDKNTRWEFCRVAKCGAKKHDHTRCWTTPNSYNGYVLRTVSGRRCQKWRSNYPHKHKYHSSPSNYCRNPDHSKGGPWCYTTDKKKRWEYCGILKCGTTRKPKYNLKKCYLKRSLDSYVGHKRTTVTGKKCQRWRSNYPHRHRFGNIPSNYCRNPDNTKGGPWCYTTDKKKRWEFCGIPKCGIRWKYDYTSCWTTVNSYNGYARQTKSGKKCQQWKSNSPHRHGYHKSSSNYCRNPDLYKGGPWCYTTDKNKRWELCGIPKCGKRSTKFNLGKCYSKKRLDSYVGYKNRTVSGRKCQQWRSNSPHRHGYHRLPSNYCRNPDNTKGGPWCYTTDKKKRWEFCGIPKCEVKRKPKPKKNCRDPFTDKLHRYNAKWITKFADQCHHYRCNGSSILGKEIRVDCMDKHGRCVRPTHEGVKFLCKYGNGKCSCIRERGVTYWVENHVGNK